MDSNASLEQHPPAEPAPPSRRILVVAALLTGAVGLGLMAFGWAYRDWQYSAEWQEWHDPDTWIGSAISFTGLLMLQGAGFKLALALVAGSVGLLGWLRTRS